MEKNYHILFFLVFLLLVSCGQDFSGRQPPTAKDGVLDLSNWDFAQDGPVKLNGQWGFFWKKLIDPKEFAKNPEKFIAKKDHIQVPGKWNSYRDPEGKEVGGEGYATYVLKIKGLKPPFQQDLAIKAPEAGSAYSLYFIPPFSNTAEKGGIVSRPDHSAKYQPVLKNGVVSADSAKTIPQILPGLKRLQLLKKTNYILVQVSNFHHRKGGIWKSISLGPENTLAKSRDNKRLLSAIVIGILLIMALYHFGLFIQRKEDKASFFFSLLCLDISLRVCLMDRFVHELYPEPNEFIFEMLYKIEYLTFYFSIPVGGSFFRQVFKYEFSRLFERLIWAVSTIFILGLLLPLRIYSHFLLYFQLAFLITGLYVVYVIIRAMMHQKEGSLITLAGFIMMFLAFLNDMFNSQGIIHTVYIFQFGLVAFIFAQSYMLSKLFANTFRRAERLNLELVDSNTKLESAYNEIVAKERARTLFFHNTSHELRTPLNGIIGFTQLLASGRYGKLGQAAVAQVGKVQKLADSLKMQVNTILDLAKAKKGELSLELSRISLDEVAEECRILAQGLITDHAHNFFDIKVATEGQNFVNDKEKLLTILRNLIGNAFKFKKLDQENRVEVQLSLKGNNISPKDATQDDVEEKNLTKNLNKNQDDSIQVLTIRVSDTGIGIPKEHLGRIFEEFKQVDGAARRSFEGTGLGLAMVKKIVDLMGGKIKVESQLDQGTTFIITIPEQTQTKDGDVLIVEKSFADKTKPQKDIVSAGEQDHADIDLAAQKSEEAGTDKDLLAGSGTQEYGDSDTPSHNLASFYSEDNGQYTILVVDDIQINVEVISELLRAAGYNVEESFGGRDALDKIKNSPPDLLLLDLMMPDVSGEDVLQAVRKDERLKELPVILVTARASKEDKLLGLGMGADDYLAKPIISEELLLRVRGILTRLELAKAMQVLVSQQSMSQVGYVMEDLARELKDLHTAVLNGFTASKEPLTNQLQSFSPLQPFFQSFLRGLFNPNTVSTKEKRQRMASHHLSVGLSPNQKKDLQIINALISELEMDEDFQLQLWESLKSLEEESLTSLRDTLETIRSFAVMQEGARISKEMLQSVLQHIHNSLKGQAPGLRQSYILVLRLLESRLTRSQIAVEMEIGEELGQGVDLYQVPQMLFNLIQVAQSILADGDLSKKRINITASQENGCLVNHITLPGLLLTEDEIRELDHGGDEGQSKPGLYLSHRLIQKRSGYLTINCVNGSTLFELGIKG